MELQFNTATNLRRLNSAIYAIKELIAAQKIDNYEFMIDTLMNSYYGIENISEDIEQFLREQNIKRLQQKENK